MTKKITATAAQNLFFGMLFLLSLTTSAQKFIVKDGLVTINKNVVYNKQQSKQILKELYSTSNKITFASIKKETDRLGFEHETLEQQFNLISVAFAIIKIHSKNNRIESLSSGYSSIPEKFNTNASLSAAQALVIAQQNIGASSYLWEDQAASNELGYEKPVGELMILPPVYKKGTHKLVYKFEIYSITPFGGGEYYIDATTGEILLFDDKIKHANNLGANGTVLTEADTKETYCLDLEESAESNFMATGSGDTRYSGNQNFETRAELNGTFTLNDDTRNVFTRNANNLAPVGNSLPYITNYTEFSDNDNTWTSQEYDNAAKDNAALDAHWGMIQCYDYFNNVHGRDSYDAAGSELRSYVHVDTNYDNAFWFLNTMSYGDGGTYFTPLTSLDVAAHELGHGVTQYSANLVYQGESGGLNEGFSDIWGAAVEFTVKGNGNDTNPNAEIWDIGEEIGITGPLRSMSNPNSQGQPDTYQGSYWSDTCVGCSDNGGVHYNSGVLNYWFYLISTGGSGTNDNGDAFDVTEIGISKSALISYRTLDVYLTSSSNFAAARVASMQATEDLYGYCSQEFVSVVNAWHAVGVGDAYQASLSLSETSACGSNSFVISGGTYPGGVYSGEGVTDDGNGTSFTFDPTGLAVTDYTVTYTLSCGDVTSIATDTISLSDGAIDLTCQSYTVTLDQGGNASIISEDLISNLVSDTSNYTLNQTGTFNPQSITGTSVSLGDDSASSSIDIGFPFTFYETQYTALYIASNGFISFDNSGTSGSSSWTPTSLPGAGAPNAIIAGVWDDLSPNISGTIRYDVVGTAPNRRFIVDFIDVPTYTDATPSAFEVTFQVQLFEGSNKIEIHTTKADNDGAARTQGIESASGSAASSVFGRNNVSWGTTNDYVAFIPDSIFPDNCGNAVSFSLNKDAFTCKDIGENLITITADDGNGSVTSCTATVTVVGELTSFNGSWDNGVPSATKMAVFNTNYDTSSGDIDACSCEIAEAVTLTIGAGEYLKVEGNIKVDGSLIVEHQGSVVQVSEDAVVTNNGVININITTPTLMPQDFMVLGTPMTIGVPQGVDTPIFRKFSHNTLAFRPHPGIQALFADGTNFIDEDSNDYSVYSSDFVPGTGYYVKPQASQTDGNQQYNLRYSDGTLNSGIITYALDYNTTGTGTGTASDNKNASPNVLSNPYASGILANDFLLANDAVDELYFWEHNTATSATFPGSDITNYNMADISIFNATGFNPASTGSGASFGGTISSGQGFGVKNNGATSATGQNIVFTNSMRTENNNSLRTPQGTDRIWLSLQSNEYDLHSTTLIGFTNNATPSFDPKYDSKRVGVPVSIYSHLPNGSETLAIQGRELFSEDKEVLLGFSSQIDAVASLYTISIDNLEGVQISAATVYLKDNYTGVVTNISDRDYTFSSDKGTFNARFTLQFIDQNQLGDSDIAIDNIVLFPNPASTGFTVVSPKSMLKSIEVFDVLGRKVILTKSNALTQRVDITSLKSAAYLVKITTQNGIVVKQLVKQ